jgi:hypothetical protein
MPSTGGAADARFQERNTPAARRIFDMERVRSQLRSTSSRVRRRLALIVEIAAASLSSAGA